MSKNNPIIVSACLAGVPCRHDGKGCERAEVMQLVRDGRAVLVCPEELGGLPTPRPAAEIVAKKVLTKDGTYVTANYKTGAEAALLLAQNTGASEAWLKSKSPMCGCGKIYDGTHSGRLIQGDGVFSKMLKKADILVIEVE